MDTKELEFRISASWKMIDKDNGYYAATVKHNMTHEQMAEIFIDLMGKDDEFNTLVRVIAEGETLIRNWDKKPFIIISQDDPDDGLPVGAQLTGNIVDPGEVACLLLSLLDSEGGTEYLQSLLSACRMFVEPDFRRAHFKPVKIKR